jgi:hypothetical protein
MSLIFSTIRDSRLGKLLAVTLLIYIFGGLISIMALGDTFITRYTIHPIAIAMLVTPPGILLAGVVLQHLRYARSINSSTLSALAFVIFSFVLAGVVFVAAIGWVAITSSLLPKQESTLELNVLSVSRRESRRDVCQQFLELQNGSAIERFCADSLPIKGKLRNGVRVKLIGFSSLLGFHIKSVQAPIGSI